jgi:hypothetical protein
MWSRVLRRKTNTNGSGRSTSLLWVITLVLLVASSSINLLLALKARRLRAVITTLKAEQGLAIGAHVPPIVAQNLAGQTETIRFEDSDRPTLLYVFTASCGWCQKNEANFKALVNQSSGKVRIIGLSLSRQGLADYVTKTFPELPVYTNLELATTSAYRFGGTPETILVSSDGRVLKVWTGAYMGETLHDIEGYLQVKLPGLAAPS